MTKLNLEFVRWKIGIPSPIWKQNLKLLREFAKAQKLVPATPEMLAMGNSAVRSFATKRSLTTRVSAGLRKLPNGGWPLPHLHVGDTFYVLSDKQWKAFTSKLIKQYEAQLAKARAIDFEQFVNIGTAVGSLKS